MYKFLSICYNFPVNLNIREKWLNSILMVYLILAMIGSFALSTGKDFRNADFDKNIPGSNCYISSIALTIDWLAEDTPTVSNVHNYSNPSLRNGLLRVFTLTGIIGITVFLAKSNFKINKNNNFPTIKNLVPFKLRI